MEHYSALAFVVDLLAAYRLTRLVTADLVGGALIRWPITRWAYRDRDDDVLGPLGPQLDDMVDEDMHEARAMRGHGDHDNPELPPSIVVVLRCRWCFGFYVGLAVAALRWGVPDVWEWVGLGLALSCAGPLVSVLEDG